MRIILLIGLTTWLAACGQKGALYLPVEGEPPPGAGQPSCSTCPVLKVPTSTDAGANQEQKITLEPQPAAAQPKKADDTDQDDATSTPDTTQETTE